MFWEIIIFIGSWLIGQALMPNQNRPAASKQNAEDFAGPIASEDVPLPLVWGTVHLRSPNVLWYGDFSADPIVQQRQVIGYNYSMGQQLGLCIGPIDELVGVRFDDRAPAATGAITVPAGAYVHVKVSGTRIRVDLPAAAYPDALSCAVAMTDAFNAATSSTDWKMAPGFWIRTGFNDELPYHLTGTGIDTSTKTARLRPGFYWDHLELMGELAFQLTATEHAVSGGARVAFTIDMPSGKIRLGASRIVSTVTAITFVATGALATSVLPTLGFEYGTDLTFSLATPNSVAATVKMSPRKWLIACQAADCYLVRRPWITDEGVMPPGTLKDSSWSLFGFPQPEENPTRLLDDLELGLALADTAILQVGWAIRELDGHWRFHAEAGNLSLPYMMSTAPVWSQASGEIDIYPGSQTQEPDDYLQGVLGVPLPAYLGLSYAVLRHFHISDGTSAPTISFIVRRAPRLPGLAAGLEDIAGDANPACVVYEILTASWGGNLPADAIDIDNFRAVAAVLHDEGLGLSYQSSSLTQVGDLLADILRHLDGVLFPDPETGLYRLRLARADYDPATLPLLDPSNCRLTKYARRSWDQTQNLVRITYTDREQGFTQRAEFARDVANVMARQGDLAIAEINLPGLSNVTQAQRAASRALAAVSHPLADVEIEADRRMWRAAPAGVFKLTWPEYGVLNMPCRIRRARPGHVLDRRVTIEAVEDVFGVTWMANLPPLGPAWVDPIHAPGALASQLLVEAPFVLSAARNALALGARGDRLTTGFEVWVDPAGGDRFELSAIAAAATPLGVITAAVAPGDSGITFVPGPDASALRSVSAAEFANGESLLLVTHRGGWGFFWGDSWGEDLRPLLEEFIAWQTVNDNGDGTCTLSTLARGCLDTVPAAFVPGDELWFVSRGLTLAAALGYGVGITDLSARFLPFNSRGKLPLADAPKLTLTLTGRAARAYPPTGVLVNGEPYPATISGALALGWQHRDRLGSWSYADSGASPTIETGCSYRLRLYGDDGVTVRRTALLAGTADTYTWTTEAADCGALQSSVRAVLEALGPDDTTASHTAFDWTVARP